MQDGSILTGIQMPPFALGLMIVERTKGTAYGTSPLAVVLMGQVDVHLSLLKFQFHALHLPRSFDTQNASIQFMILHSVIFAWRRDISQNQRGCLSQSFPFPSISGTGSERPAAARARRFSGAAQRTLTARTVLRQLRQEGKAVHPTSVAHYKVRIPIDIEHMVVPVRGAKEFVLWV